MNAATSALRTQPHPAPHRERVSPFGIWFAIVAGPLAWSLQLLFNAGIAAHGCFPHDVPVAVPASRALPMASDWIALVAIVVCIVGGLVALRNWRRTREERPGSAHHLLEGGDGRSRFLAMVGLLTSGLFLLAVLLSGAGLAIVPPCG